MTKTRAADETARQALDAYEQANSPALRVDYTTGYTPAAKLVSEWWSQPNDDYASVSLASAATATHDPAVEAAKRRMALLDRAAKVCMLRKASN